MAEAQKRGRGRPPGSTLPPEQQRSATVRARVTPAQAEKFSRLGAAQWLRAMIDKSVAR